MEQKKPSFEREKIPANVVNQNSYFLVSVFSAGLFLTVVLFLGFNFILIIKNSYYLH